MTKFDLIMRDFVSRFDRTRTCLSDGRIQSSPADVKEGERLISKRRKLLRAFTYYRQSELETDTDKEAFAIALESSPYMDQLMAMDRVR